MLGMREISGIELIGIFGGLAALFVISFVLRLINRFKGYGIRSMWPFYVGMIVIGGYLAITQQYVLGFLFIPIGAIGLVWEAKVGTRLFQYENESSEDA